MLHLLQSIVVSRQTLWLAVLYLDTVDYCTGLSVLHVFLRAVLVRTVQARRACLCPRAPCLRVATRRVANMAEAEPHILVRQKTACLHTALRFASRPCVALSGSTKGLMDLWRDAHNRNLSPAALKREGKVVSLSLSQLCFRSS